MTEERFRFGHLRCRETRKPSVFAPPVHFFRCPVCKTPVLWMGEMPGAVSCCNRPAELLALHAQEELEGRIRLSYQIIGSLNENAIRAAWECTGEEGQPVWIWLRTFSGGQLKYIKPGTRPPVIFGLAGEDAYAYCDKDPCVECTFRCKRGFGLYFYFENQGVIHLPLDRMCARQQTKNQGLS